MDCLAGGGAGCHGHSGALGPLTSPPTCLGVSMPISVLKDLQDEGMSGDPSEWRDQSSHYSGT